jgi:ribosomal protein S6--L-glutamate ligase
MKLYFMLAQRDWATPNPVMVDLLTLLRQRRFEVTTGVATQLLLAPGQFPLDYDLYILKSRSLFWLSMAGIAHHHDRRVLNPYPACVAVRNKIIVTACLQSGQLPVPRSWVVGDVRQLQSLLAIHPLILKPCYGDQGRGIQILRDPEDLAALPETSEPWLVQQYIPHTSDDIKVYAIGEHLYAVRKPFGPGSFMRTGTPYALPPELHEIVRRCGQVLNVSLYGVDMIEGPDGPVVVDVNLFPAYRQMPKAARLLADHIASCARQG